MDISILREYGVDYEKGIARCMDDEEMYAVILGMFLDDGSFERAQAAYGRQDYDGLFRNAHELKGASGNAALTGLYKATSAVVESLRHGLPPEGDIDALFAEMEREYDRTREGVRRALAR